MMYYGDRGNTDTSIEGQLNCLTVLLMNVECSVVR